MKLELIKARSFSLIHRLFTYLLEGVVVFIVLTVIPNYNIKIDTKQAISLSLLIASTLAVLDAFTTIGNSTRQGMGYGLGFGLVGFPKN